MLNGSHINTFQPSHQNADSVVFVQKHTPVFSISLIHITPFSKIVYSRDSSQGGRKHSSQYMQYNGISTLINNYNCPCCVLSSRRVFQFASIPGEICTSVVIVDKLEIVPALNNDSNINDTLEGKSSFTQVSCS